MHSAKTLQDLFDAGLLWIAQAQSRSVFTLPSSAEPRRGIFGLKEIDNELPGGGLSSGALHEWFNSEPALPPSSMLCLLARNILREAAHTDSAPKTILWIGKRMWPAPFLLEPFLSQCLFLDPPNEKLHAWSIETALRSPSVAAVIAACRKPKTALMRRFALAAKTGNTLGLLVRDAKEIESPALAASRWRLTPLVSSSLAPRWKLSLLKWKGHQPLTTEWTIELQQSSQGMPYEEISLHIPADVVNQSSEQRVLQEKLLQQRTG